MWQNRVPVSRIVVLLLSVWWLHGGQGLGQAAEPERNAEAIRVDITIKARQFQPSSAICQGIEWSGRSWLRNSRLVHRPLWNRVIGPRDVRK